VIHEISGLYVPFDAYITFHGETGIRGQRAWGIGHREVIADCGFRIADFALCHAP